MASFKLAATFLLANAILAPRTVSSAPSSPPPETLSCSEDVLQRDYRGTIAVTRSKRTCQRWDAQSPHRHYRNSARYPGSDLVENYCRNPDNEPDGAWCYTTDPEKRWELCDVPKCVRFQKFNFTDPEIENPPVINFPINADSASILREKSRSISVILPEDKCTTTYGVDMEKVKEALRSKGLFPVTHPGVDDFWDEFNEVVQAQVSVQRNRKDPCEDSIEDVMPQMTDLWKGFGIEGVAEAVHDEFPGVYHNQMIANWLAEGSLKGSNVIIPKTGMIDFLRGPVFLSDMVGFAIRAVGECNFVLKWEVGRARPEEVAYKAIKGDIAEVPTKTRELLEAMKFEELLEEMEVKDARAATAFTAYDEGSPTHPSWPAMHSAASAGSYWLDITQNLTEEQLCEARMLDYSVSYARTVAGVHYRSDNIAGLIVGQEILAQMLPSYLHEVYGSDKDKVAKRAKEAKYDWTKFKGSDCYTQKRFRTVRPEKPEFCPTQDYSPYYDEL